MTVYLCPMDEMMESPQPFKPLSGEVFPWTFSGLGMTYSSRFWCCNKMPKAVYFIKKTVLSCRMKFQDLVASSLLLSGEALQ